MKHFRRFVLFSLLASASACGGGGGSGGGGGTPAPAAPPPPPAGAVIALPASSVLASGAPTVPYPAVTFTATGTAPFTWTISGGLIPPGLMLSTSGVYSGTPLSSGSFIFTVRVTDANGFATRTFNHEILASVPESEPNNTAPTASLLPPGMPGTGSLGSNDVDYWLFAAAGDDVIQVEIFGTRKDFAAWDANEVLPKVSIIGTDGASFLLGHDAFAEGVEDVSTGWLWMFHDMDTSAFRVPAGGNYYLRIEPDVAGTPGGGYAVRVNVLSQGSLQAESEPNDFTDEATAITPGTIRAFHADEDFDVYSFTVAQATIVTFEVFSYRNGISGAGGVPDDDYYDPQILLLDVDGFGLSGNDDTYYFDSKLKYRISTPGTYFLVVYESDFQTAGDGNYLLTFDTDAVGSGFESEPNDDPSNAGSISYGSIVSGFLDFDAGDADAFAFTGTAGDMIRVYWQDVVTHETAADKVDVFLFSDSAFPTQIHSFWGVVGENSLRAILPASGTYYIVVLSHVDTLVGTDYTFQLTLHKAGVLEIENNNSPAGANAIPGTGAVAGAISSAADVDVFSFTAQPGELAVFSIHAGPGPVSSFGYLQNWEYYANELLAPELEIIDSLGTVLGVTTSAGAFCSGEGTSDEASAGIAFVAPTGGTFYIRVSSADGIGGPDALYVLEKR